jgi:undecaprenyl-diphosphatase
MNPFDERILSFINRFAHRSLVFDELVVLVSDNNFVKGALVIAVIWYLWFQNEDTRTKREFLLAGVGASFVGLVVARMLSWIIVRPRPLNIPEFVMRMPYGIQAADWEGWNSFPSDHSVLFFALTTGIFFAARRTGCWMFIYVFTFICLPRVYLGIHYPTDILVGALIGVFMGWLFHLPAVRRPLTGWAFRWLDARPAQFYAFSFLLTYQICELFDPVRGILNFIRRGHLPQ